MFCILTFPESEKAAPPQEVGNIGNVACKVEDSKKFHVPAMLYSIHAKPLDLLLEPPAMVANCVRGQPRLISQT